MRPVALLLLLAIALLTAAQKPPKPKPQPPKTGLEWLKAGFLNPPDSVRPGVYWYFMDGNLDKAAMTADLEAMKQAGIGNVVFLEVNVGVPRGPVNFLSDEWKTLFRHAVGECERLGIDMTLGVGPGWTGSGGPWVKPQQSMQHLVATSVAVQGPGPLHLTFQKPQSKRPFFGIGTLTPDLRNRWEAYSDDVALLAFPTPPVGAPTLSGDINEKALYYRPPYTSVPNVLPYFTFNPKLRTQLDGISPAQIINLTGNLNPNGTLDWNVPPGNWTLMRFSTRNNGAVTRPAPEPGLGFESDKMDTAALNDHLRHYMGWFLNEKTHKPKGGLQRLHMDSWEMGAQNWTTGFREAFRQRRGYDPLPYFPVYAGLVVESSQKSERFLWDVRQTAQELVLENHAQHLKTISHRLGLKLSIEPYDMNPTADLELGAVADIPMCEFWSKGYGFNSAFSCTEAASIAHVNGISLVPAEAFTAEHTEAWKQYPGSMKNQGDWAFAAGINQFFYHTFQHKFPASTLKPGVTMGPYGVHWDRGQTWWPMVADYHRYISRSQFLLQQGRTVADILYLTPEGAPHVFLPPPSAFVGDSSMPDRRGYNFDGCAPSQLLKSRVEQGQIVFPGGATYRLLVLPNVQTMTPTLLAKIKALVEDGATVVGNPPAFSPSLTDYPACDQQVKQLASELWPSAETENRVGKGRVIRADSEAGSLYPTYSMTANLLKNLNVPDDFLSDAPIRYTHRTNPDWDIYFVSNRSDAVQQTLAQFRVQRGRKPQLWHANTGAVRALPDYAETPTGVSVPLTFQPHESYFIVFGNSASVPANGANFQTPTTVLNLDGAWDVSFDPKWGGPAKITFSHLDDWTKRPESGIRYYSGIATYSKRFDAPTTGNLLLDLGTVNHMARVRLNGHDLGVVWTAPWQVSLGKFLKPKQNLLEIDVANLWPNRLIGDEQLPDDGPQKGRWPDWLLNNTPRTSGRYTFTTHRFYKKDSPLLSSGLLGPVTLRAVPE